MEENKDVIVDSSPESVEPVTVQEPVEEPQKPPKGYVPNEALFEERRLRKEAEDRLRAMQPAPEEDAYSEEGKLLRAEIKATNEKLQAFERKEARREVESKYAVLKDKREEFEAFMEDPEIKSLSVEKAAKLFMAENNLLDQSPQRKGLEKPTGGGVTPPKQGYTDEELEDLRKNNWRKYEELIKAGKI